MMSEGRSEMSLPMQTLGLPNGKEKVRLVPNPTNVAVDLVGFVKTKLTVGLAAK